MPIELDIHLLKDNTIVVFHDNNLKRMTGENIEISSCTYPELMNIFSKHASYKIPTLLEVLDLVKGKVFIDIEIKDNKNYKQTCKELTKILDYYDGNFIIKSFQPKYIHWFYKHRPKYIRGILLNEQMQKHFFIKFISLYCRPNFYAVKQNILTNEPIKKIRNKHIPILAWTIRTTEELKCIKPYTDGIILDFKNYQPSIYPEIIEVIKKN